MSYPTQVGTIGWIDLTVEDAPALRDFYSEVAGWRHQGVPMGDYEDYNMLPPASESPAAGICHARGENADLPAAWIIYIIVEDLDASIDACRKGGGEVISGPRSMGDDRYCFIRDPAGAAAALYQKG